MDESQAARERMVRVHIEGRGVADARVLDSFRRVPREIFVPPELADRAYDDGPLPIGGGQTISQPSLVAEMIAALELRGGERVLEVGTGSGYVAALLAHLARRVDTVERDAGLASRARERLDIQACANVRVHTGDGTLGWPEHAPYDAILVSAAGPRVPPALVEQLADGGRLVIPVESERGEQRLFRLTRSGASDLVQDDLGRVMFVPLIGAQGFEASHARRGGTV